MIKTDNSTKENTSGKYFLKFHLCLLMWKIFLLLRRWNYTPPCWTHYSFSRGVNIFYTSVRPEGGTIPHLGINISVGSYEGTVQSTSVLHSFEFQWLWPCRCTGIISDKTAWKRGSWQQLAITCLLSTWVFLTTLKGTLGIQGQFSIGMVLRLVLPNR